MSEAEVLKMIKRGEDSQLQFKRRFDSASALAAEIAAMANSRGGIIIAGVDDNGEVIGITEADLRAFNQLLSSACSQKIEPALQVFSRNVVVEGKLVVVLDVPQGTNKFYVANGVDVWVKYGADKRRAKREDLQRLLQESANLFADEQPLSGSSLDDLDKDKYLPFLKKRLEHDIETEAVLRYLQALKAISRAQEATLGGMLLFGYSHSELLRAFGVGAVSWYGSDSGGNEFRDSEDIFGSVRKLYTDGLAFMKRQLKKVQAHSNFNFEGVMEIPEEALQEALINAIVHRNYFVPGKIRIMVFDNRVEIASPGALPNSLDVDSIKLGMHIPRNPVLVSCIRDIESIPYRGMGTGIARIIRVCSERGVAVEFENDSKVNQFKVVFYR